MEARDYFAEAEAAIASGGATLPLYFDDQQLLAWLNDGTLVIPNPDDFRPTLLRNGRVQKPELTAQRGRQYPGSRNNGKDQSRWTWKICGGYTPDGKRKSRRIVCAKLVWMNQHRRLIRDGAKIHHDDENRWNDAQWNLTELTHEDHEALHGNLVDDF